MIVKLWTKSLSCHKHGSGPVADRGNFCGQIKIMMFSLKSNSLAMAHPPCKAGNPQKALSTEKHLVFLHIPFLDQSHDLGT